MQLYNSQESIKPFLHSHCKTLPAVETHRLQERNQPAPAERKNSQHLPPRRNFTHCGTLWTQPASSCRAKKLSIFAPKVQLHELWTQTDPLRRLFCTLYSIYPPSPSPCAARLQVSQTCFVPAKKPQSVQFKKELYPVRPSATFLQPFFQLRFFYYYIFLHRRPHSTTSLHYDYIRQTDTPMNPSKNQQN